MTDPTRWFILVNPASGGGRAGRYWPRLRAALERRRVAYDCVTTAAPGDATERVARAIDGGYRRLLALGGDGTFHELIQGLLAQHVATPAQCLAAILPLGTGNDWARAMAVPGDPDAFAGCLARGRGRTVDLGMATVEGGARLAFHNVAGAGLDAEVLRYTPLRGPRPLAYLIGLLRTMARFRAPQFKVVVDGREQSGRYWLALAANGPRCGGGMRLAPGASLDDGWLDLVTVEPMPLLRAIAKLPQLFDGRIAGDAAFRVTRCRTVTIDADPPCGVELDGQAAGRTPLALSIMPAALCVLDCRRSAE